MPQFFALSNSSDPRSVARDAVKIRAMVTYLFENAVDLEAAEPSGGDPEAGGRAFRRVGCLGCHRTDDPAAPRRGARDFAPPLAAAGSSASARWLAAWLRDPHALAPDTRMPRFELEERTVRDLAAYLSALTETAPPPPVALDEAVLERMVVERLRDRMTEAAARARCHELSTEARLLFLGEAALAHHGCGGCHALPGNDESRERFARIGPDFTGQEPVGDKRLEEVDFGFVAMPRTWHDWIDRKLRTPRIFDAGREKRPHDRLRMPRFALAPEDRRALIVRLLSYSGERIDARFRVDLDAGAAAKNGGERLLRRRNCRTCHRLDMDRVLFENPEGRSWRSRESAVRGLVTAEDEQYLVFRALETRAAATDVAFVAGEERELEKGTFLRWTPARGGDVHEDYLWAFVEDAGLDFDRAAVDRGEDAAMLDDWYAFWGAHEYMLPPPIDGQGAMVQPDWLVSYLKRPTVLRLHLRIRMPDFNLSADEAQAFSAFFAARDGVSYPFAAVPERTDAYRERRRAAIVAARELFERKDVLCIQCHIRGTVLPEGNEANWGPDMALTPERLRPSWVLDWLTDPQLIRPGTTMPTYPTWTDEERRAMKDFLMNYDHFYRAEPPAASPEKN
jgi:cytochrome c2